VYADATAVGAAATVGAAAAAAGEAAGEAAGDAAGEAAGDAAGEAAGLAAGDAAGEAPGEAAGDAPGEAAVAGEAAGLGAVVGAAAGAVVGAAAGVEEHALRNSAPAVNRLVRERAVASGDAGRLESSNRKGISQGYGLTAHCQQSRASKVQALYVGQTVQARHRDPDW
jgi:hypothetical protein